MPPSRESAKIAKRLRHYFLEQFSKYQLREIKGNLFVFQDHPDCTDAREMASAAIVYLGLDDNGRWTGMNGLLKATISFVANETKTKVTANLMKNADNLKKVLSETPVRESKIHAWFAETFPHDEKKIT